MLPLLLVLLSTALLTSGRSNFVHYPLRSSEEVEHEYDYVIVGGGTVRLLVLPNTPTAMTFQ